MIARLILVTEEVATIEVDGVTQAEAKLAERLEDARGRSSHGERTTGRVEVLVGKGDDLRWMAVVR